MTLYSTDQSSASPKNPKPRSESPEIPRRSSWASPTRPFLRVSAVPFPCAESICLPHISEIGIWSSSPQAQHQRRSHPGLTGTAATYHATAGPPEPTPRPVAGWALAITMPSTKRRSVASFWLLSAGRVAFEVLPAGAEAPAASSDSADDRHHDERQQRRSQFDRACRRLGLLLPGMWMRLSLPKISSGVAQMQRWATLWPGCSTS